MRFINFEKRLTTVADMARETREQAQHTLERVRRLRRDLRKLHDDLVARASTNEDLRIPPGGWGKRPASEEGGRRRGDRDTPAAAHVPVGLASVVQGGRS